jgi:hypothetical protein
MIDLTYQQILHDVALRLNALTGTSVGLVSATYDNANLNASHFKSADWPFNSFRDTIVMAVGDFAWTIADTGSHPWRASLAAVTAPLATGVTLPSVAANNREIIGVLGSVRDSVSNIPLTEQPLDVIRRANQSTWRTYPLYYFKIDGSSIEHTRPFVEVECCTYSHAEQLTLWNANGLMPLPSALRAAIGARAISLLTKDSAWESQARIYRDYSNDALTAIRGGLTTIPSKALPGPTMSAI